MKSFLRSIIQAIAISAFLAGTVFCQESGSARTYIERGTQRWHRADYAGAIAEFTTAIDIDEALRKTGRQSDDDVKRLGNTYLQRARLHRILRTFDLSFLDIQSCLTLLPDWSEAYYELGFTYMSARDPRSAIASYTKAIELDPRNARAYRDRGHARNDIADAPGEISDFDKSIEIDPKDSQTYFFRGITFANQRKYERAIADYTKMIELIPNDDIAYKLRAEALLASGHDKEAERDVRRYLELRPDDRAAVETILKVLKTRSTPQ